MEQTHTLPVQITPFVGRQTELREITARLDDPACRLLTLLGFGGIGKTRLALEAAGKQTNRYRDGVCFVALQPLKTSDFIMSAIAEALGFRFFSSDTPQEQLIHYLRDKNYLLLLDNFEHLLDGAPLISDLLRAAPELKVLVTSREALNLQEEWLYPVEGMAYADSMSDMETFSAVQLFVQSAHRNRPDFSLTDEAEGVLRICTLVEGMPLGIELAAAWVRLMSCDEIADEMEHSLDILETPSRNVPSRQRTMRTVLEHSWSLLTEAQRKTFAELTLFRGGFTREAALAAAGASRNMLSTLVGKSWLRWDARRKRYDVHELLRQFGEDHLRQSNGDWRAANQRHCDYFADFMAARGRDMAGDKDAEALTAIEADLENVRAFWTWAVEHQRDEALSATLDAMWFFYDTGSRYQEGERLFSAAVDGLRGRAESPETRLLLGKLLARQASLCRSLVLADQAKLLFQEAEVHLQAADAPYDRAFYLQQYGVMLFFADELDEAKKTFSASLELYVRAEDSRGIGYAHLWLEAVYRTQRNFEQAREHAQTALDIFLALGNQRGIADAYLHLAYLSIDTHAYHDGWRYGEKSLVIFQQLGVIWGIATAYREKGWAALRLGQYADAYQAVLDCLSMEIKYHLVVFWIDSLWLTVFILGAQNKHVRALELLGVMETTLKSPERQLSGYSRGVQRLLAKLESELPAERYTTALERGRALDFEATVKAMPLELEGYIREEEARNTVQPLGNALTVREVEVLRFLAAGLSNRDIAHQLTLSLGTVKWYLNDIYSKLGVGSRTQAVVCARELNLLP